MKLLVDLVSLAWFSLLACSIWLWVRKHRRAGLVLLVISLAAMLCEITSLPLRLLALLERPYLHSIAAPAVPVDAIVVCGGGLCVSASGVSGLDFGDSSDRILRAVELARGGVGRELVLGGGGKGKPPAPVEAQRAKAWLESWKLVALPVTALPACRNTHDEALRTAELARQRGWKTICLITSAWHMRRARAVFEKAGLTVIPVASDFRATTELENQERFKLIPGTDSAGVFNLWLREIIGHLSYKLRGWS